MTRIHLRVAVVQAFSEVASESVMDKGSLVWERVKAVPGADEETVKSVAAGLTVATANRNWDFWEEQLARL